VENDFLDGAHTIGVARSVVDHIGWAVRSIEASRRHFESVLGLAYAGGEQFPGLRVAFFGEGPTQVELLEPLDETSMIAAFVAARGEGLHHIALRVDDVSAALHDAGLNGLRLIDARPRPGARGTTIGYVDPQRADGVLIQYVQDGGLR
jgi:methylmalonyl-CoA epimerase